MHIPRRYEDRIREINVDAPVTVFSYSHWHDALQASSLPDGHLKQVHDFLGERFTRADVVNLYKSPKLQTDVKFLAAMIWGHEAGEGERRNGRGLWKVSQMLENADDARKVLEAIDVNSRDAIADSYTRLSGALKMCGPNFFTKHLYFLGKAKAYKHYPVIFDNRVAPGISSSDGGRGPCLQYDFRVNGETNGRIPSLP